MQIRRVWVAAAVVAITVGGLAGSTSISATAAPSPAPSPAPSSANQPAWATADRTGSVRLKGLVPLAVVDLGAGRPSVAQLLGAHQASATITLNFALPLRNGRRSTR